MQFLAPEQYGTHIVTDDNFTRPPNLQEERRQRVIDRTTNNTVKQNESHMTPRKTSPALAAFCHMLLELHQHFVGTVLLLPESTSGVAGEEKKNTTHYARPIKMFKLKHT